MENMEKYFTIRNGRVSGLSEKMGITLSQEAYDALSEEKKNDGTIYFIPDGDGEIGIQDTIISENSVWSSQKIATELKTSSNTDVTHVTLTNGSIFESMGDTYCKYQVKNGICYFQFFVASKAATDTFIEIYNGLPKPTFSQYFSYPVYYNSQGLNKTLQVNISEGGLLTAANTLPTTSYMIAGSYPIA